MPQSGLGGYPIPGLAGGYPIPDLVRGYPIPGLARGVPPDQVRMGYSPNDQVLMGYPLPPTRYPLPRDLAWVPGMGYPPDLGQGTPRPGTGYTPRPGTGYHPPDMGRGTPPQHSEHLLRGGWYASCVHAGGLSCYCNGFNIYNLVLCVLSSVLINCEIARVSKLVHFHH